MRARIAGKLVVVAILGLLIVTGMAPISGANSAGDMGAVSPTNPVVVQQFDAIDTTYPKNCADPVDATTCAGTFYSTVRQPSCNDNGPGSSYCDTVIFHVDYPDFYPEIHFVKVSLSWPDPAQNDMDMFVWNDWHAGLGPAYGRATTRDLFPETVLMGEPDRDDRNTGPMNPEDPEYTCDATNCGGPEDADTERNEGRYWITVVNWSTTGAYFNPGYTITLEWGTEAKLGGFSRFSRQAGGGSAIGAPKAAGTGQARPIGFGDEPGGLGSGTEASPIKVPGADGELVEQELPVLTLGERIRRSGMSPIVPIAIAILLMGAATGGFLFWRRKKAAAADTY